VNRLVQSIGELELMETAREVAELAQLWNHTCDLALEHSGEKRSQHRIVVVLIAEAGRILEKRHGRA
jgi:hypothetical protein